MNKMTFMQFMSFKDIESFRKDINQKYINEYGCDFFDGNEHLSNHYLCYFHKDYGMIGAAKIVSSKAKKPFLENYFKENGYDLGEFWQVSHIFFSLPSDADIQQDGEAFELLCQKFYQELKLSLILLGKEKEIPMWVVMNSHEEHENTKYFGKWEYAMEHPLHYTTPNKTSSDSSFMLACLENRL